MIPGNARRNNRTPLRRPPSNQQETPCNSTAKTTALVLIDLQKGVLARPVVPHPAATIFERSKQLAPRFRSRRRPRRVGAGILRQRLRRCAAREGRSAQRLWRLTARMGRVPGASARRRCDGDQAPVGRLLRHRSRSAAAAPRCAHHRTRRHRHQHRRRIHGAQCLRSTATSSSSARICALISTPRRTPSASNTSSRASRASRARKPSHSNDGGRRSAVLDGVASRIGVGTRIYRSTRGTACPVTPLRENSNCTSHSRGD